MNIFTNAANDFAAKVAANPQATFAAVCVLSTVAGGALGSAFGLKKRLKQEQKMRNDLMDSMDKIVDALTKHATT